MGFTDLARSRRMTRSFDASRPVREAELDALLAAAATAPSAGMTQGWDLVVLRTPGDRERFWAAGTGSGGGDGDGSGDGRWLAGMRTAPMLLVVLGDPGAYERRYGEPDKARARAEVRAEADRARPARAREAVAAPSAAPPGETPPDGAAPEAVAPEAVAAPAGSTGPSPWWLVDSSMAAMLLLLAAGEAGLGACFFGVPPQRREEVLDALGGRGRVLVGVVAVGVPAAHPHGPAPPRSPHRRARRAPHEVAHESRLGTPLGRPPSAQG